MKKLLFLLSVLLTTTAFAQTGNIRGFVYEKESGEPVMFCNVILKGTTIGAATDINGMYNISKVNPGNYTLIVTYIGYDTTQVNITLKGGQILSQNLEIREASIKLNEVKISGERVDENRSKSCSNKNYQARFGDDAYHWWRARFSTIHASHPWSYFHWRSRRTIIY